MPVKYLPISGLETELNKWWRTGILLAFHKWNFIWKIS